MKMMTWWWSLFFNRMIQGVRVHHGEHRQHNVNMLMLMTIFAFNFMAAFMNFQDTDVVDGVGMMFLPSAHGVQAVQLQKVQKVQKVGRRRRAGNMALQALHGAQEAHDVYQKVQMARKAVKIGKGIAKTVPQVVEAVPKVVKATKQLKQDARNLVDEQEGRGRVRDLEGGAAWVAGAGAVLNDFGRNLGGTPAEGTRAAAGPAHHRAHAYADSPAHRAPRPAPREIRAPRPVQHPREREHHYAQQHRAQHQQQVLLDLPQPSAPPMPSASAPLSAAPPMIMARPTPGPEIYFPSPPSVAGAVPADRDAEGKAAAGKVVSGKATPVIPTQLTVHEQFQIFHALNNSSVEAKGVAVEQQPQQKTTITAPGANPPTTAAPGYYTRIRAANKSKVATD